MKSSLKSNLISSLIPRRFFLRDACSLQKGIYLTFDDGPIPGVTDRLLEQLDQYQAKASFFVIGSRAKKHPNLIKSIAEAGHVVANHSFTHPAFHKISLKEQWQEVISTKNLLEDITGQPCNLFRAPQGRWNLALLMKLFTHNIRAVHWNRDSMDYLHEPAEIIAHRFKEQPVSIGDILLFHDDNILCVETLEHLLPQWKQLGTELKALEL